MTSSDAVEILIVDDREDGLIALQAVLQGLPNVTVISARSGAQALSLLDHHNFAVILLDVQMPFMDGFETAQRIRMNSERYKLTPIIFVTAINKDDEYIYKGYASGAVDYVFKPFEPQILRSKVSVFIELFRKNRQIIEQAERLQQSERKERFLRLAELEVQSLKRYTNLADSIPHIVWKAGQDGKFDYFNSVWTQFTGLTSEQSLGLGWQEAIHPVDLRNYLKVWISAMQTGESFELEVRIRRFDGDYRWHWIRAVPEVKHEVILNWIGTCTDIHDRKLSEEKLKKAQVAALSANRAKTHFLANMSHEIRTPMSAILGFTELMLHPDQSAEQRAECISVIRRSGQNLLTIIDEILDISKVEAGHMEVEMIETNLANLLMDIHALLQVKAQPKGLQLNFALKNSVPEMVTTDPTRLRQIVMNIVGNAIKFTSEGSIDVMVSWLSGENKNSGKIQIHVRDTGVGIDRAHIERLFLPFGQVDSSTTRKFGGTGLGLALSRKLAEALGGNVALIESEPGRGSLFEIVIAAEAPKNCEWITEMISKRAATPSNREKPDQSKKLQGVKVLLVDDAPDNQTVIGLFLGSAGAEVDFADNGSEGIEKAMAGDYNVVLMDIQMPEVDGYEATQRLRKRGYQKPIIALTAHALKEERDRCLSVGCTDHFTKPIDKDKLVNLVENLAR